MMCASLVLMLTPAVSSSFNAVNELSIETAVITALFGLAAYNVIHRLTRSEDCTVISMMVMSVVAFVCHICLFVLTTPAKPSETISLSTAIFQSLAHMFNVTKLLASRCVALITTTPNQLHAALSYVASLLAAWITRFFHILMNMITLPFVLMHQLAQSIWNAILPWLAFGVFITVCLRLISPPEPLFIQGPGGSTYVKMAKVG